MKFFVKVARLYSRKFVSQWVVLAIDSFFVLLTFVFSYVHRFNFDLTKIKADEFLIRMPLVLLVYVVFFLIYRSYSGIIRHTSIKDAERLFLATTTAFVTLILIAIYLRLQGKVLNPSYVPFSIQISHYLLSLVLLISSRFFFKLAYYKVLGERSGRKKILIFGSGVAGRITKETLLKDTTSHYKVVAFVDNNKGLKGKLIEGIPVLSLAEATSEKYIEARKIDEIIIAVQNIKPTKKSIIIDQFLALGLEVKSVPPVSDWIGGELSSRQIKKVNIEDLLQRDAIEIENENVKQEIAGKNVLITGAAGSIGSEIARQVLNYNPASIVLVDQAETPLYEIDNELKVLAIENNKEIIFKPMIADVSDERRISAVFRNGEFDIVFHAAAYKHVPMMEAHPKEAVRCNIRGTKLLADLSAEYNIDKFVMVSTDKAVNPTNVMGASKRIAEMYVQARNLKSQQENKNTKYITTRFGNVLGSNGSVVPLFRKQIARGGPVIVTHPDITRYFMTIPEACQLVLEAGVMGQGGEIFIFDMGKSVKIVDLAKRMIQLSGLKLGVDIEIKFSGLRPGEKLYEELLNDKESTLATYHDKIMIGQVREVDYNIIQSQIIELLSFLRSDNMALVKQMKKIVPEFMSNESIYEVLDKNQ